MIAKQKQTLLYLKMAFNRVYITNRLQCKFEIDKLKFYFKKAIRGRFRMLLFKLLFSHPEYEEVLLENDYDIAYH